MRFTVALLAYAATAAARDAGILYEVWHSHAAQLMATVLAKGGVQLTTELVINSQDTAAPLALDDVYTKYGLNGDIYGAQPQLGYYCLYRKRAGDANPPLADCANITETATAHAALLTGAGFDYVAVDVTNWPQNDTDGATDTAVLRPTEVLFEEWLALRARGMATPKIAVWPCSPAGGTTWRYLLDTLYNNASYADLVYTQDGKKVVFLPYAGANCWNEGEAALIRSNGGRNDVVTIPMWALFGEPSYGQGAYGFFAPCVDGGAYTTSMVDVPPCNQYTTQANGTNTTIEVSASGGYMVSQCALPFAAPGHMRGLTVARLFEKVLSVSPPHLFMSSFNEMIGGRQAPAYGAKIAINQGLPNDSQKAKVWVDSYAAEFSRDIEPTVEGGNRTWLVASACVQLYKAGQTCADAPQSLCCTREDKEVYSSVWSMARKDGGDFLLTALQSERQALLAGGAWDESCHAIGNPTAFCVDGRIKDGRSGPFLLFNGWEIPDYVNGGLMDLRPLYRCITSVSPQTHYISADPACEGGTTESVLGYMQARPGREMVRALTRCKAAVAGGPRSHSLDLACDSPDGPVLGYVR